MREKLGERDRQRDNWRGWELGIGRRLIEILGKKRKRNPMHERNGIFRTCTHGPQKES